ncbi:MAG: hypothetical protein HYY21_04060 [Candidatus Tectomicrobia bacterium]|nr:hypothetical protein [Candidatus Tectomicrobia bacterium]
MRRRIWFSASALTLLLLQALPGLARAATQVTLGVDWVIYGISAPYFVAKEKGYYAVPLDELYTNAFLK